MPKLNYCTEDWKRLFATRALQRAQVVLHMAAVTHADEPTEYFRVNAELTKQLVSACSPSQHFIYVSTICAHPNGGAYGRSKWIAEEQIRGELDYTIIRPSEIYGSRDGEGIDALIAVARKVHILPDFRYGGSIKYAPISTEEAAHFIAEATIYRRQKGRTYTLSADRLCTAPEMARALRSSVRPLFGDSRRRRFVQRRRFGYLCHSRAIKSIGSFYQKLTTARWHAAITIFSLSPSSII